MMNVINKVLKNNEGTSLMVFAITIPLIIGALAVSIEAGYWMQSKKELQMDADMAAYAGALELLTYDNDAAETAAVLQAMDNGFDFDKGSIVVNSPPTSGTYAGGEAVEVLIEQKGNQYFSAMFGDNKINYSVRSVAGTFPDGRYCALALNATERGAFSVTGSSIANFNECAIGSNSNHSDSVQIGNTAALTAECIDAVGGISGTSSAVLTCDSAQTGVDPIEDPFSSLAAPDLATEYPTCNAYDKNGPFVTNLAPGRYCDDLKFGNIGNFTGGGIYIFDGIDASFNTGGTPLTGVGITIILMNGATISGLNGSEELNISASTSGPYEGIVIFSDPATQPAGAKVSINGGSISTIEGLLYFPNQELKFGGNTSAGNGCTMLIADIIDIGGNADLDVSGCSSRFGIGAPTGPNVIAMLVE
jgi:hypothetical protein